jgi:hypothetical protein
VLVVCSLVCSVLAGPALPGADPLRMDLYVELVRPEGGDRLTASEEPTLKQYWAEMPVANPDGSTGISTHVARRTVEGELVHDHDHDHDGESDAHELLGDWNRSRIYR